MDETIIASKITTLDIPYGQLNAYFRMKCRICSHQRIAHDDLGKCEGVMNKPCTSGCDKFMSE
ncbi:MAG: hypothetical protein HC944_01460 [Nanoarchaeota archaeon]|nr:hypothetical protein [Nanoarchaeota archaeon]